MFSYLKVEKENDERGIVKTVGRIRADFREATSAFQTRFTRLFKKVAKKKTQGKKPYSFFGNLRSRLFWILVGIGKAKLMEVVMAKVGDEGESN